MSATAALELLKTQLQKNNTDKKKPHRFPFLLLLLLF